MRTIGQAEKEMMDKKVQIEMQEMNDDAKMRKLFIVLGIILILIMLFTHLRCIFNSVIRN